MDYNTMSRFMDIFAILFIVATGYYVVKWIGVLLLKRKKGSSKGEIIHVKIGQQNKREKYEVEYQFQGPEGKELSRKFTASRPEDAQLGAEITVYYDPQNPEKNISSIEDKYYWKIMIFCLITIIICGIMRLFA